MSAVPAWLVRVGGVFIRKPDRFAVKVRWVSTVDAVPVPLPVPSPRRAEWCCRGKELGLSGVPSEVVIKVSAMLGLGVQ